MRGSWSYPATARRSSSPTTGITRAAIGPPKARAHKPPTFERSVTKAAKQRQPERGWPGLAMRPPPPTPKHVRELRGDQFYRMNG